MDKHTLSDLNIPNYLLTICPDENVVKDVVSDMQTLEQCPTAITQRQREIADFIDNPELLSILLRQIRQLDDMKEQHRAERLSAAKSRAQSAQRPPKEQLGPIISNIAVSMKQAEEYVRLYSDLPVFFRDFAFSSDFLMGFKASLLKIIDSSTQARIKTFSEDIQALYNAGPRRLARFYVKYTLDETLNKLHFQLSQLEFDSSPASAERRIAFVKKDSILNILRGHRTRRNEEEFEITENFFSYTLVAGLSHLMDLLSQFMQNLQRPFEYINKRLSLYKFGIALAAGYKTRGEPYCFPEMLQPGVAVQVPHPALTLRYGGDGIDYFDFLQEQALLQLYAQAGYPLSGEKAQVAIVTGLFAQLPSNELMLGRFEEEVREMSALVKKIKPHGMVLFHEVFQSTAYEDIAEPFAGIVNHLLNKPCRVVVVTHNNFLVERLIG